MLKKKKLALVLSAVLVVSMLAMMISAAPLVKDLTSAKISATEAENIALNHLGMTRENIRFERTELDRERGNLVWKVEFEHGRTEYSYEIRVSDGKVLTRSIENDD